MLSFSLEIIQSRIFVTSSNKINIKEKKWKFRLTCKGYLDDQKKIVWIRKFWVTFFIMRWNLFHFAVIWRVIKSDRISCVLLAVRNFENKVISKFQWYFVRLKPVRWETLTLLLTFINLNLIITDIFFRKPKGEFSKRYICYDLYFIMTSWR